jgi:uncharacterized protein YndB with AHSA1/START domain
MAGPKNDFVISRDFDVPRETLWACFTEPERMRRWWGPKGCKVVAANMDLRPGGSYHYGMQMPDGGTMWGKFLYREIAAPERMILINFFSDEKGGAHVGNALDRHLRRSRRKKPVHRVLVAAPRERRRMQCVRFRRHARRHDARLDRRHGSARFLPEVPVGNSRMNREAHA